MNRALLKSNARQQLGGGIFKENWLNGLVAMLIFSAILSAASSVFSGIVALIGLGSGSFFQTVMDMADFGNYAMNDPELSAEMIAASLMKNILPVYAGMLCSGLLVSILLTGPFTYGLGKTFLDLVMGGEKVKIESVFSGFRKYGENVLLGFMMGLFTALWSLLFIIPGIVKAFAYSMSFYVKVEHPDYGWRECMKESERLMKGYKFSYFVLQLSFIGWYIVGMLTFGIGMLWVLPYQECTNANFYAWLSAQKRGPEAY
jgi:uncharacterized membrane protein